LFDIVVLVFPNGQAGGLLHVTHQFFPLPGHFSAGNSTRSRAQTGLLIPAWQVAPRICMYVYAKENFANPGSSAFDEPDH
jgi:hypothetical protein